MIARDMVIGALQASPELPAATVSIEPFTRDIGTPPLRTIMVRFDELSPGPRSGSWAVSGALVLIEPQTEPGAADVALEDFLHDVLTALDTEALSAAVRWTSAKRSTFQNTPDGPGFPAFEITFDTYQVKE